MVRKLIIAVLSLTAILSAALGIIASLPVEYEWPVMDETEVRYDGIEFKESPWFRVRHTTILEEPYSKSHKPGIRVGPFWTRTFGPIYFHVYVYNRHNQTQTRRTSLTQVPSYVPLGLALLLGAYPIIAFCRGPARRWRRLRKGLCVTCGYDLTGNESGICPECGRSL